MQERNKREKVQNKGKMPEKGKNRQVRDGK